MNMRTLPVQQKDFLVRTFFKNDDFPGWEGIAEKLILNGECIVAGTECIWQGGIGNFITLSPVDTAVGCVRYEFDFELFLTSVHYREVRAYHASQLRIKMSRLKGNLKTILDLPK